MSCFGWLAVQAPDSLMLIEPRTKPKLAECNVKVPAFQVLGYFGNHQNQCSSTAVFVLACFGMILKRYENYPLTLLKPGACQQYEGLHCQSGAGGSKMVPDIHQRLSNDRVHPRKKNNHFQVHHKLWLFMAVFVVLRAIISYNHGYRDLSES